MALRDVLILLVLGSLMASVTAARELSSIREPGRHSLSARLEESGGLVECWNALNELKSCTNEIVLYFVNGKTDIGPGCCRAIEVITRNCWPAMLTSLGFTSKEGNIIRGYCDASSGPAASALLARHLVRWLQFKEGIIQKSGRSSPSPFLFSLVVIVKLFE